MQNRRNGHSKSLRGMTTITALLAVIIYGGILVAIKIIGTQIESKNMLETTGSLEGRFVDDEITFRLKGGDHQYRKRQLTNILFIGLDREENQSAPVPERYGAQADFLLLATIDRERKTISTLQIDRDTMTPIRIFGAFGDYAGTKTAQICLSQAYGNTIEQNCNNTVWAVSQLLGGIPIDGYVMMTINGIAKLNDALGGITVKLEDDFSDLDPNMTEGTTLRLQGIQAEYYFRHRFGIGTGTNLSRMGRQRAFIQAAGEIIAKKMTSDLDFIGSLYDQLSPYITTDITRGQLINRAYESKDYDRHEIQLIAGSHKLGEDGFIEFWTDNDALEDLLMRIFFEQR